MTDTQSNIVANMYSDIDGMIRGLDTIVDATRPNRDIGRNLALAITHLEAAQDKINRAIRAAYATPTKRETPQ